MPDTNSVDSIYDQDDDEAAKLMDGFTLIRDQVDGNGRIIVKISYLSQKKNCLIDSNFLSQFVGGCIFSKSDKINFCYMYYSITIERNYNYYNF